MPIGRDWRAAGVFKARKGAGMIAVPVLPSATCRAWPKHATGGRARYLELGEALTRSYPSDAHFACYAEPSIERRLCKAAPATLGHSVSMVVHAFDVDGAEHRGDDAWWIGEREKIGVLFAVHAGGYAYRTKGGYRLVYLRRTPFEILAEDDARRWSQAVFLSIAYLRRFEIAADPSCCDWTRLYRCPRATRDVGALPENRETIGDPFAIGLWAPAIGDEEKRLARAMRPRKSVGDFRPATLSDYRGDGLFFHALRMRGWLGAELEPGMFAIRCPNEGQHTHGGDTATVLFTAQPGKEIGCIHCKHAHCTTFGVRDWLRCFSEAELDAARRAAGIRRAA